MPAGWRITHTHRSFTDPFDEALAEFAACASGGPQGPDRRRSIVVDERQPDSPPLVRI